ncbi:hypothetical protein CF319_g8044 [Tilletia indica]|nr:hypothetical protein CF319_g8044 [Tilletia indica]
MNITEESFERILARATEAGVQAGMAAARANMPAAPPEPAPTAAAAAAAAAAAQAALEKDKATKTAASKSKSIFFVHDPTQEYKALRLWEGSDLQIPKDLVNLARQGDQVPLIWLTPQGVTEAAGQGRKLLTFPLTGAASQQIKMAHAKDLYLPRGAFSQAMQALVVLWKEVGPAAPEGERSQASLIEELHLSVLARATDEHWPIWRRYVKSVLNSLWAEREDNVGMSFDIGKIDEETLRAAERAGFCPRFQADDTVQLRHTMVAKLVRAEGAAMLTLGARMDELHNMATFGNAPAHLRAGPTTPTSPRATGRLELPASPTAHTVAVSSHNSKRKEREENAQPFRGAPATDHFRGVGANPYQGSREAHQGGGSHGGRDRGHHSSRTSTFCVTCLQLATHSFRGCTRPHFGSLVRTDDGWALPGKKPYCAKYNLGDDCVAGDKCTYGHYCSACGKTCRARDHLGPRN